MTKVCINFIPFGLLNSTDANFITLKESSMISIKAYTDSFSGPPNGDSNDEIVEFDPIKYHNCYCPWVNENVAAAGCSSNSSSSSSIAEALCGWQLTIDALDSFQSLENAQIQPMESESAASLCKVLQQLPFPFL